MEALIHLPNPSLLLEPQNGIDAMGVNYFSIGAAYQLAQRSDRQGFRSVTYIRQTMTTISSPYLGT
jgi:hypothetical protein